MKVGDEQSTCVVPTVIYQTIQVHDDSLRTTLLFTETKEEALLPTLVCLLNLLLHKNFFVYGFPNDNKQLLDDVFVISGITKVKVSVIRRAEGRG